MHTSPGTHKYSRYHNYSQAHFTLACMPARSQIIEYTPLSLSHTHTHQHLSVQSLYVRHTPSKQDATRRPNMTSRVIVTGHNDTHTLPQDTRTLEK